MCNDRVYICILRIHLFRAAMMIFDFDGVTVDSLTEVMMTSYNSASGNLATHPGQLPRGFERLFRRNRYHVQPAADFSVFADWCARECARDPDRHLTPDEYREILASATESPADRRDHFFATRRSFFEKHRAAWFDLNAPYRPLWDVLIERGPEAMVVLTNKNKPAVLELCHHFGLKVLEANIYSAEAGATKMENLDAIRERFTRPRYYFIDDSLSNLRDLQGYLNGSTDVELCFADWGYVGPRDRRGATDSGFPSFSQEEFIDFLERVG